MRLTALALISCFVVGLVGCGDDGGMDSPDAGAMCVDDADCSDGIFCNGSERCAPAEAGADGRGCVAASDPCFEGQECSESEGRCVTVDCSMPDLDGDGTESIDCGGTDCDDGDDTRFPGNPEICDAEGHDEDCDPATLGPDADGDGFAAIDCCNGSLCGQDCDDELAGISPDAVEACNGVDEDCDGDLDEGAREVFYRDLDGDGFGDPASPVTRACVEDPLFSRQADDCDDRDTGTHPGAAELCDGRDNDCNASTAHDQDADGDGHLPTDAICTGGDLPKDDCDDANPFANGGAPERCSGIDDDCDGTIDEAAADDWCTMQAHSGSDTTATALCGVAGTCTLAACGAGRADCDGVLGNGCETDLEASADDCGACGVTCPSGVCTGGVCQRETGPTAATMVALRSGHHAVCALTADEQALCWGEVLPFEQHARPAPIRDGATTLLGIVDVVLGRVCVCALMNDGRVRCLGAVDREQSSLCDGTGATTAFVVTPTAVRDAAGEITNATALAAAGHTGCVVRESATVGGSVYSNVVYCWGAAPLGDGSGGANDEPQMVVRDDGTPFDGVTDIDGGEEVICAVASGQVYCWGRLPGTNTIADRPTPILRNGGLPLDADTVAVGGAHACALNDTALWCWGDNRNGAVSIAAARDLLPDAVSVAGSWVEVAPAERAELHPLHTCARTIDDDVQCWGEDVLAGGGAGTLGTGCSERSCTIQGTVGNRLEDPMTAVSAGDGFSCGVVNGWAWCWGEGEVGQLGVSDGTFDSVQPVPVPDTGRPVQAGLGLSGGCGRTATGAVSCWGESLLRGSSYAGGNRDDTSYPMNGLPVALDMGVGATLACVLGTDRQVRCFGGHDAIFASDAGFLGGAALRPPESAQLIAGLTDVRDIEVADMHACAIKTDGTVWCWGESDAGATGEIGPDACAAHQCSLAPHQVAGLPATPVELALGGVYLLDEPGFSCARLADGRVACWGSNRMGTLGDGTGVDSATPVLVQGLDDAVEISARALHVCARRSTGELFCWGADLGGTLGTLDRLPGCGFAPCSVEAVRSTSLRGIELVGAGTNRTCASTGTGAIYCWGGAGLSELADTGPVPAAPVPGLNFPRALEVGFDVHCAVTLDALRCWGRETEIADGLPFSGSEVLVPRPVVGL